ncbi:MAG: phosphatidate cytidylyltransferase [Butyrivibrio sp.]|nr:phosphatidate cytidylyltransferase [Acetatifactor muris]MCM1559081.1 phosphatidate cytidylyltransferase [Butyrivibrio sp.]
MFWTRLLSGAVLLVIAFVSFWVGAPLLPAVLYVVSLIGFLELTGALGVREEGSKGISVPELVGIVAVTAYYGVLLLRDVGVLEGDRLFYIMPCIVFLFLGELLVYVLAFPKYRAESVMASIFAFLYAPVMLSFIDMTRMHKDGILLVWLILISAWGCDTCAYCVGKLVGRRKIFPRLSPKKTLGGCIGGVIGAALIGVLYGVCLRLEAIIPIAVICGLGGIAGMVGDLAASAIKRNRNIKDYGKLIPGHGGIMDRFDSVIVTAPLTYFLIVFLLGR